MRHHSLVSLLASFLLLISFVAGQQSDTAAPPASQPAATPPAATDPPATQAPPPPAGTATGPVGSEPPPVNTNTATTPTTSTAGSGDGGGGPSSSSSGPYQPWGTTPPDVLLRVPNLSIGKIELDVENLQAEVNLAAEIANLVSINAGVQIGIRKVNITISDVSAQVHLIIRLGHLVDIVNRTLASLDLNPLLINLLNEVTDIVENVVGAVDGLLGSIIQGGTRLNFLIDNLGNIVQEVVGDAGKILSSIVGNFQDNMTFTGQQQDLGNGLTQKTYSYSPLGTLVNIVFNTLGQVVQAVAVKSGSTGGGTTSPPPAPPAGTSTPSPAPTAAPAR